MEYFIVKDLGFDGLAITKYSSKEEAEKHYAEEQLLIQHWIEKYGEKTADKGLALIEGNVLKSQDIKF